LLAGACFGRLQMTVSRRSLTADAIQRLAAKNGIASEFINARGEAVSTDLAVQTRLLESMGILAPSEQPPGHGIPQQPEAQREVFVVKSDKGRIAISLGGVSVGWSIGWEITFENGSKRSGVAKVMSSVWGGANEPAIWLADIPCGYHELRIEANDGVTSLIVTPGRC